MPPTNVQNQQTQPADASYPNHIMPDVLKIESFFRMIQERGRYHRSKWAVRIIRKAWRKHGKDYIRRRAELRKAQKLVKVLQSFNEYAAVELAR